MTAPTTKDIEAELLNLFRGGAIESGDVLDQVTRCERRTDAGDAWEPAGIVIHYASGRAFTLTIEVRK